MEYWFVGNDSQPDTCIDNLYNVGTVPRWERSGMGLTEQGLDQNKMLLTVRDAFYSLQDIVSNNENEHEEICDDLDFI